MIAFNRSKGLAVLLAASLGACEVEVEPPVGEAHVGELEQRSQPSDDAVIALANDPLFAEFLLGLSQHAEMMLEHMVVPAYTEHGAAAGEQLFHRLADYRKAVEELGLDPDEVSLADAEAFTAVTGLPLAAVAATVARARTLDDRHGLLAMSRAQLEHAATIALADPDLEAQVEAGWSDPSVLIPLGAEAVDSCVVECAERTADTWVVVSGAAYVLADILASLGIDVAFILVEGALVAVSAVALAECIEECGADDNTCESDSDCEPKEYCDKGWLTIGKNQCVFSRDEGEICTRAAQCKSGCCKYHAWSHPFHPVCRPPDKCD